MATPRQLAKRIERRALALAAGADRFSGYGAMGLVLESGHTFAFQRCVRSSIGPPFTTVWQREPDGDWRVHTNVEPGRSSVRYLAPDLRDVRTDDIDVVWKSRDELAIYVRRARLHVAMRFESTPVTRAVSAGARLLLPRPWRAGRLLELLGRGAGTALGTGPLPLHGRTPTQHTFHLWPRGVWRVQAAATVHAGRDLGAVAEPALFVVGSAELVAVQRDRAATSAASLRAL